MRCNAMDLIVHLLLSTNGIQRIPSHMGCVMRHLNFQKGMITCLIACFAIGEKASPFQRSDVTIIDAIIRL